MKTQGIWASCALLQYIVNVIANVSQEKKHSSKRLPKKPAKNLS